VNKIIFFDLENTLIPDWIEDRHSLIFLQHPILREWIINQMPFRAGLFSFAVWDDNDVKIFNNTLRKLIEEKLFLNFEDDLIITKKEVKDWINEWNKTPWNSADDNSSTFKKDGLMQQIWRFKFNQNNTQIVLLDDTVDDMVIQRSTFLPNGRAFASSTPIQNNSLELVNPWSIIRELRNDID
jgi:hypothetical protein